MNTTLEEASTAIARYENEQLGKNTYHAQQNNVQMDIFTIQFKKQLAWKGVDNPGIRLVPASTNKSALEPCTCTCWKEGTSDKVWRFHSNRRVHLEITQRAADPGWGYRTYVNGGTMFDSVKNMYTFLTIMQLTDDVFNIVYDLERTF